MKKNTTTTSHKHQVFTCLLLIIFSSLSLSSLAAERISGRMGIVSNYLFRGESWSDNKPALQGGLNYDYRKNRYSLNLSLGTSLSKAPTLSSKGIENSFFGKYSYRLSSAFSLHVGGMSFDYPHDTNWNFGHYALGASWKHLSFQLERWATKSLGYSLTWSQEKFRFLLTGEEHFWGKQSSYLYSEASQSFPLREKWDLSFTLGYASFGDNLAAEYSNHYNAMISLVHRQGNLIGTLFFSDTNRVAPETGKPIEDATLGASLVKSF